MSAKEINCKSCNFIFGNEQLFNIHLKKCRKGFKNSDPKNSYACPVCDGGRYFRLFSNLLRHQETKKHSDLLNWYLKQFKTTEEEEMEDTPIESSSSSLLEDESNTNMNMNMISNEINDLKNFENDLESNLNSLEKELKINNDDFFNKLEKDIALENSLENTLNNKTESEIKSEIEIQVKEEVVEVVEVSEVVEVEEVEEEEDDFIKNLIKEREKDLKKLAKPVEKVVAKPVEKENVDNKKQVQFNLNDDIKNAKEMIEENKMSLSFENSDDIEINDNILDIIQSKRTEEATKQEAKKSEVKKSEVNKPEVKKQEPPKPILKNNTTTSEQNNVAKYPPQMRENQIWKLLFKIINEPKPIDNFMTAMTKMPINEYPKVCAFIYFVEELENNLEMKAQLIMCLMNIYNNFVRLINIRQFMYNGINLLQVVSTMNTWKLNDTLINTKNKLALQNSSKQVK